MPNASARSIAGQQDLTPWTPVLSELGMDYVFGKIEQDPLKDREKLSATAKRLCELSDSIIELAEMVTVYPQIAGVMGLLGLACVLQEDFEQLELIEWLNTAPVSVRSAMPDLRPVPSRVVTAEPVSGRVLPFPRSHNNAAWLKEVERARGEVRP